MRLVPTRALWACVGKAVGIRLAADRRVSQQSQQATGKARRRSQRVPRLFAGSGVFFPRTVQYLFLDKSERGILQPSSDCSCRLWRNLVVSVQSPWVTMLMSLLLLLYCCCCFVVFRRVFVLVVLLFCLSSQFCRVVLGRCL